MRRVGAIGTALLVAAAGCQRSTPNATVSAPTAAPAPSPTPAPVALPTAPIAAPIVAPAPGHITALATAGLDPNDAAVVATVEARLPVTGHSFVAHRIPIEKLPAEVRTAGAELEVTYLGEDVDMQVIVLVLRDPATARQMLPVLGAKQIPSSTWVVATWSGRGVLVLVSDTGTDDAAGAEHVKAVVAALSGS